MRYPNQKRSQPSHHRASATLVSHVGNFVPPETPCHIVCSRVLRWMRGEGILYVSVYFIVPVVWLKYSNDEGKYRDGQKCTLAVYYVET